MTHTPPHSSPPSRFRLEFTAFCEANRDAYLRYAQLRLQDPVQARQCVDTVFTALGRRWPAVLASDCPAARVWKDLRAEAGRRTVTAVLRGGRFHTALRDDQADVMLLHHRLRMPIGDAAGLMGLPVHDAQALLCGAERVRERLLGR